MAKGVMLIIFSVFIVSFFNATVFSQKVEIIPRFVSLQYGSSFQLSTNTAIDGIIWKSNNPKIEVSKNGLVSTKTNEKYLLNNGQITITNSSNTILDSITVSLVNWASNISKLVDGETYQNFLYLGNQNDSVFSYNFYTNPHIYLSQKDIKTPNPISSFHKIKSTSYASFLANKFGYLIKDSTDISFSRNLKNWELVYKTRTTSFRNSICQYLDSVQNKIYFFTADYHTIDSLPISIYRGEITSKEINVKPIYTFFSRNEFKTNSSNYPQARHVHTINIDPYTNDIWVGTGDDDSECFLMYSNDNGNSWNVLGTGSQDWRTLSFWFTEGYIYWSMDTGKRQKVFRIPRTKYAENNSWPCITPVLKNGSTKPGVNYFIKAKGDSLLIPNKEGTFFIENKIREIKSQTELIPCNDSIYDYREVVANLENSAHWFSITVLDSKGDQIVLLSTDSEGKVIDDYSRVFGLKERTDGTVDVQEVYSVRSSNKYTQLMPCFQNSENSIFYWGYYTDWKIHKMELDWNDNSETIGGIVKEDVNMEKSSDRVNLKLENYDGKIMNWQISDQSMKWKSVQHQTDTITAPREQGVHYYRAIVKKDNQPAVSSLPFKLNNLIRTDSTSTKFSKNKFKIMPLPAKDYLMVYSEELDDNEISFEIYNVNGSCILKKKLFSSSKFLYEEVILPNLSNGVYVVKINGIKTHFAQKITVRN